eukprot:179012-Pleurochrysis_carterae.AAC.4
MTDQWSCYNIDIVDCVQLASGQVAGIATIGLRVLRVVTSISAHQGTASMLIVLVVPEWHETSPYRNRHKIDSTLDAEAFYYSRSSHALGNASRA